MENVQHSNRTLKKTYVTTLTAEKCVIRDKKTHFITMRGPSLRKTQQS